MENVSLFVREQERLEKSPDCRLSLKRKQRVMRDRIPRREGPAYAPFALTYRCFRKRRCFRGAKGDNGFRSRLMNTRIADGVAQNQPKKFRISTSFGGCERKVLLAICLCIVNILGDPAKLRKPGGLAEMRNVDSRNLGRLANLLPILEVVRGGAMK
jgi:hypothetical protein